MFTRAFLRAPPRGLLQSARRTLFIQVSQRYHTFVLNPSNTSLFPSLAAFLQTGTTPNPQSLKFLPGRLVYETEDERGFSSTPSDPPHSPLATRLFTASKDITSCYLGYDFVTVNISTETTWEETKPTVFSAIMDHYASGDAAVLGETKIYSYFLFLLTPSNTTNASLTRYARPAEESEVVSDTEIFDDDSEVVAMIKELLEVRIRPAVQEDGGDIKYVDFSEDSGMVSVRLEGEKLRDIDTATLHRNSNSLMLVATLIAGSCVGCPSSSVTLKSGVENMLMHYIPEVKGVEAVDEEGSNQLQNLPGEDGITEEWNPDDDDGKPKMTYEERLKAAGIPFSD